MGGGGRGAGAAITEAVRLIPTIIWEDMVFIALGFCGSPKAGVMPQS
jgi:hypothetical protein